MEHREARHTRETASGTLLKVAILAVALLLFLPTPAAANGWQRAAGEILLIVFVLPVAFISALGVLIALVCRVFRSRRAILVSYVFSAIASVLTF